MEQATVTAKGQITIPVKIRNELGVKGGDRVLFIRRGNGITIENAKTGASNRKKLNFKQYGKPTERGQNVEDYMKEIRANDRI